MTKQQIIKLLHRRQKLAEELMDVCGKVDDYIVENKLEDKVEQYDWLTGCEVYCNPLASSERVIAVIEENVKK